MSETSIANTELAREKEIPINATSHTSPTAFLHICTKKAMCAVLSLLLALSVPFAPSPAFAEDDGYENVPNTSTFKFDFKATPAIKEIQQTSRGLKITLNPAKGADGHVILRRMPSYNQTIDKIFSSAINGDSLTLDNKYFTSSYIRGTGWTKVKTLTEKREISWTDTTAVYGQSYQYCVIAYKKNLYTPNNLLNVSYIPSYAQDRDISLPSTPVDSFRVKAPTITSAYKKAKSSTMTVKWNKVSGATGYIIQVSKNSAFAGRKTITKYGDSNRTATFTGLSKTSKYCARVIAFDDVNNKRYLSHWSNSTYTKSLKKSSMSRLYYKYKTTKKVKVKKHGKEITKKKKVTKYKVFELRERSRQRMGQYDTMQGGCSDGKYNYFVLLNKVKKACKIAKVSRSTNKVVKVSGAMKLSHGNGLAYNPDTKRVIVAHGDGNAKALTEVSSITLKKMKTHVVNMPSTLKGANISQLKAYRGFYSIAYSKDKKVYAGVLMGTHDIILMDSNFNMVEYIPLTKKINQTPQALEIQGDTFVLADSFASGAGKSYNILSFFNWDGTYTNTTRLQQSHEIENVFAVGNALYAGFYRSYTKNKKFMRDGYVYRIKTF